MLNNKAIFSLLETMVMALQFYFISWYFTGNFFGSAHLFVVVFLIDLRIKNKGDLS